MSESETKSPVAPGEVFAGKYRVESVLGIGGMGVVVAATHLELGQRVAVKFLVPELAANPDAAVRFSREARAAVQLTSEHAVRVHDVGQLESGAPYMVMEFLEGADLGDVLQKNGALDVAHTVQYTLQALDALSEAHAVGIIHRDLKPSNLFLARRGRAQRIKVLDFGISKQLIETQGSFALTGTSAILGSPYYMAPEQMRSTRTVDQRADIWSLGVIMYELSTGHLPFQANTLTELCLMIAQDTPPPLRTHRADLPAELEAIIKRCLAKDPADRFATANELAEQLEALGASVGLNNIAPSSGPISTRAAPTPSSPAIAPVHPHANTAAAMTLGQSGQTLPVHRSGSRALIALGAALAAVILVATVFFVRGGRPQEHAASSPPAPTTPSSVLAPIAREAPPVPSATAVETATAVAAPVEAPSTSAQPVSRPRAAGTRPAAAPRAAAPAASTKTVPSASNASTFSHDRQ